MIFALFCKTRERNQNVPILRGDIIVMMASFMCRKKKLIRFALEAGKICQVPFAKIHYNDSCLCFGKFLGKS